MSSCENGYSNRVNGNQKIEYIIEMPNNWNEKYDENKFYKVSEVKESGDIQYQEIRPLTPKRINNAEKHGERNRPNSINQSNNHEVRNKRNYVNTKKIPKDDLIKFYKGDIPIPKMGNRIKSYTQYFKFESDNYDELLDWLFPTEGIDKNDFSDCKIKENYKKMVEKAIYLIEYYPNNDKAYELLIKLSESVKVINPDLLDKINALQNNR